MSSESRVASSELESRPRAGHAAAFDSLPDILTSALVVVGTQHFDALVAEVDRLVEIGRLPRDTFGQIGSGHYVPRHFPWVRYERDLWQRLTQADLIITHGGTGLVMECLQSGRAFIAVPDELKPENHQLEFLEALAERFDYCWARRPADLEAALDHARPARRRDSRDVRELAGDILAFVRPTGRVGQLVAGRFCP